MLLVIPTFHNSILEISEIEWVRVVVSLRYIFFANFSWQYFLENIVFFDASLQIKVFCAATKSVFGHDSITGTKTVIWSRPVP